MSPTSGRPIASHSLFLKSANCNLLCPDRAVSSLRSSSPARVASSCVERALSSCARTRDGTSRLHQRQAQPELSPPSSYILWTTIWSSRNRNTDSCLWGLYFRYEIVQRGGSGLNGPA